MSSSLLKIFVAVVLVSGAVYFFKLHWAKHPQTEDSRNMAIRIVQLLSLQDWKALAAIVHPTEGVYLSKFTYIPTGPDPAETKERAEGTLMPDVVAQIRNSRQTRTWEVCGVCDGEEAYEELTVGEFLNRHIYDRPFARVSPGPRNEIIQRSQVMVNIEKAFSGEIAFYEFHILDAPNTQGGWASLRVILKKEGARWYWVGLVRDQPSV